MTNLEAAASVPYSVVRPHTPRESPPATVEIAFVRIASKVILAPTKNSQDHALWDIYPFKEGGYDMREPEQVMEMAQDLANLQNGIEERVVLVAV